LTQGKSSEKSVLESARAGLLFPPNYDLCDMIQI